MKKQTKRWLLSMICLGSSAAMMAPVMAAGMHMGGSMHAGAPNVLPEYVVTASRVQTKNLETPASVTVITRKDIERNHYENVMAALRNVPGVRINSYAGNRTNFVAQSLYINGSDKILVLINGQRVESNGLMGMNPAIYETNDMSNIERIEVLKGSAATLYGSDAVGGVINIITRTAKKDGVKTAVNLEAGSFQNRKETLYNEGRHNNVFWNIGLVNQTQGNYSSAIGTSYPGDQHLKSINLGLGVDVNTTNTVRLSYTNGINKYVRPNDLSNGNVSPVSGNTSNSMISLQWQNKASDKVNSDMSVYRYAHHFWDYGFGLNTRTVGATEQVNFKSNKHTVTTGIDYRKDTNVDNNQEYASTGVYIQDNWSFTPKANAITGLRYVHNSAYGNQWIPAFTLQYMPNDATTTYVTAKKFFVAPTLYQMYNPGNPTPLKAATGHEFDLGAKHEFNDGSYLEGQLWYRESSNQIIWNNGVYDNIGKTKGHGLNLTYTKPVTKHLSANIGYAYTNIDPTDQATRNNGGSLPVSQWDLGLTYHDMYFNSTLSARGAIGRHHGKYSQYSPQDQTSYWVFDWNANYRINKNAHAYITVNNIFNKYYTATNSPLVGPNWYPAPGRSFNVGVNYNF